MRIATISFSRFKILILLSITTILLFSTYNTLTIAEGDIPKFDGTRAYQDVLYQVSLGPRLVGSQAHGQETDWLTTSLTLNNWEVEIQNTTRLNHKIKNIIARRGHESPWIIIGAHYDSRKFADRDPDTQKRKFPVPGANDGASGVAILTELSRVLPKELPKQIWLVFLDAEDNGNIEGWDWILGSRAFVENLESKPDAVVILDMVGDENLDLYYELNSDPELSAEIWQKANQLGYSDVFRAEQKYQILDDHVPFLEQGIKAIDIIDFDYPNWHKTTDTPDKVSALSLQIVGETILQWLLDT